MDINIQLLTYLSTPAKKGRQVVFDSTRMQLETRFYLLLKTNLRAGHLFCTVHQRVTTACASLT